MEGDDERRETAVLRGAIPAEQAAHGKAPGLQVQAQAEAHLHSGRQKAQNLRVQADDEVQATGDEDTMVSKWGKTHYIYKIILYS